MSSEYFDWKYYIDRYEDLRNADIDNEEKAINHWINHGKIEGRICEQFDWKYYINRYEDLRNAGIDNEEKAWNHLINHGKKEGRICYNHNINKIKINSDDINSIYNIYYIYIDSLYINNNKQYTLNNLKINNYNNNYLSHAINEINALLNKSELKILPLLDIILNKKLHFYCLNTQKIVESEYSTYIYIKGNHEVYSDSTYTVFQFNNDENSFFVIFNNGSGLGAMEIGFTFIWYYIKNTIYFNDVDVNFNDNNFLVNLCNLIKYNYHNNKFSISKKIAIPFGYSVNVGHSLFNEMSGLDRLIKIGLINKIDSIIIGPYNYYNIELLLQNYNKNIIYSDINDINTKYNEYIICKPGAITITESLTTLITNKNNFTECEDISNYYPIINIVLRCGNRIQNDQVDNLSNIINNLYTYYPNMYLIFDGYTNNNSISKYKDLYYTTYNNKDQNDYNIKILDEYNNIYNDIIKNIKVKNYKSILNLSYIETGNILNKCNYTIYQVGSGCTISSWVHNIPGIVFGRATEWYGKDLCCSQDMVFFPKTTWRTYLNKKYISYDKNDETSNYNIDWRIILCHIYKDLNILEKIGKTSQFDFINKYNFYYDFGLDDNILININNIDKCFILIKEEINNILI